MKRSKFVRTIALVSAVALAGSTAAIARPGGSGCMGGGGGCKGGKHGGGMGVLKMIDKIPDLTDQQEDQLWDLARKFKDEAGATREKMMTLKMEYHKLIQENAEEKQIEAKAEEIGKAHAEMLTMKASHKRQIAQVLTEKQREYMKENMWGGKGCRMKGRRGGGCPHKKGMAPSKK